MTGAASRRWGFRFAAAARGSGIRNQNLRPFTEAAELAVHPVLKPETAKTQATTLLKTDS